MGIIEAGKGEIGFWRRGFLTKWNVSRWEVAKRDSGEMRMAKWEMAKWDTWRFYRFKNIENEILILNFNNSNFDDLDKNTEEDFLFIMILNAKWKIVSKLSKM